MASPQTANGYTRLANELVRAFYLFPFSGRHQLRLVLWIVRESYGWNRKETQPTSVGAIAAVFDEPRSSIGLALQGLITSGVVIRDSANRLRLNKNHDEWLATGPELLPLSSSPLDAKTYKLSSPLDRSSSRLDGKADAIRSLKTSKEKVAEFRPPTLAEIKAYCATRKNTIDAEKFFYRYESNGWMSGSTKVKNWKSLVCFWERTDFDVKKGKITPAGKPCPLCDGTLPYPNAIVCDRCGARCRSCQKQTALLKIITRADKTKTAVCKNGCEKDGSDALAASAIPKATKAEDAARHSRFMAEHDRKKSRKENA